MAVQLQIIAQVCLLIEKCHFAAPLAAGTYIYYHDGYHPSSFLLFYFDSGALIRAEKGVYVLHYLFLQYIYPIWTLSSILCRMTCGSMDWMSPLGHTYTMRC